MNIEEKESSQATNRGANNTKKNTKNETNRGDDVNSDEENADREKVGPSSAPGHEHWLAALKARAQAIGQAVDRYYGWPPELNEGVQAKVKAYKKIVKKFNEFNKKGQWSPVSYAAAHREIQSKRVMMVHALNSMYQPSGTTLGDFLKEEPEELKIIIEGILKKSGKMTIGGASKMGKTWTMMNLALCITSGTIWLETYKVNKGKVFYVNFELMEEDFRKRWASVARAMDISLAESHDNLVLWTLRGHFMDAERFKEELISRVGDQKFDVVVIDPLYKLLNGKDANSAGDMQKLLAELEQITTGVGAALIYLDHFSKGNQSARNPADRISGSGVNARDPDDIGLFTEHEESGCLTVEWILRSFKPSEAIVVQKDPDGFLFKRRYDLDAKKLKQENPNKQSIQPMELFNLIPESGIISPEDWAAAALEKHGASETAYKKTRKMLKNPTGKNPNTGKPYKQLVDYNQAQNVWFLTSAGVERRGAISKEHYPKLKELWNLSTQTPEQNDEDESQEFESEDPKPEATPEDILNHLSPEGMEPGDWKGVCVEKLEISRATFYRIVAECLRAGTVKKEDGLYKPV